MSIVVFRDYGIFITNIIPGGIADKNGRLKVGDRLMHVQSLVRNSLYR
jgi:C-terminal processing protease CtpA/Prc